MINQKNNYFLKEPLKYNNYIFKKKKKEKIKRGIIILATAATIATAGIGIKKGLDGRDSDVKNYFKQRIDELSNTHQEINFKDISKDAKYMRKLGYDVSEEDLISTARVIKEEAGNYQDNLDFQKKQKKDMYGISNVIINRALASKYNPELKKRFANDEKFNFEDIILKSFQFSAANSKEFRENLIKAIKNQNIYLGYERGIFTNQQKQKLNLAYITFLESAINAKLGKFIDPTGGATHYKNNYVVKDVWHKKDFSGNYKMINTGKIEAHSYYSLKDKKGNNPISEYQKNFQKKIKK
jgi:hypothetical protein